MANQSPAAGSRDPLNLSRFVTAQEGVHATALSELRGGRKRSHWMWYIFPQLHGLGMSSTSQYYGLGGLEEARAYLEHPTLGKRLRECSEALLSVAGRSASEIFGYPDDLKLHSSMTLFSQVAEAGSVFHRVLEKYFRGTPDKRTLELLGRHRARE